MNDPVLTIKDLLATNWSNANTSISYDPDVHTGWHSSNASNPQVTVTNPDEGPVGGGETGYAAIDPTGAGGVQEIDGVVNVDCWSDRDVEPGVNPKKLTFEMTEEVKRIATANQVSATDLRVIAYLGRTFVPPSSDDDPVTFHYNVEVGYSYESRP